ncbi:type IV conjugative transfer system protein TraL [Thiomonas sp.]
MANGDIHRIARDLDKPIPILFWDPVEFVIAVSMVGFGVLVNMWVIGMLAGAAVLVLSTKLKRGAKPGAVQHWLWSLGLQVDPALKQRFLPSWKNDFFE